MKLVEGRKYGDWTYNHKYANSFCDRCGRDRLKTIYRFDKETGDFLQLGSECLKQSMIDNFRGLNNYRR